MSDSEVLKTYLLDDPDTLIPMSRKEFYDEQIAVYKKTGKPTRAVEVIQVFIFNSDKEMLVQKRSSGKGHNPGLLDKSIGGHISYGDTSDFTVMIETVQELLTPSIVLRTQEDFSKTRNLLHGYLETISIIKHLETKIILTNKIIDDKTVVIANKAHVYFGIYDGRTRPVDKESKGILYYSLPDLEKEFKRFPNTFTDDLIKFYNEFKPEMKKFLKIFDK